SGTKKKKKKRKYIWKGRRLNDKTSNEVYRFHLLVIIVIITLSLCEPGQEWLSGLPNLLAGGKINVLLGSTGAPLLKGLFVDEVFLIQVHEDSWDLLDEIRVIQADKTFDASKECFL